MTASQQLRAGLAYLETHEWSQGPGYLNGGACAAQALHRGSGYYRDKAVGYLTKPWGSNAGLFKWNDTPGRTKEEVIALYHKAIALAEADEAPVMDAIDEEFNAMFVPEEVCA